MRYRTAPNPENTEYHQRLKRKSMMQEEDEPSSEDMEMRTASGASSSAGSEMEDGDESPSAGRRYKLRRRQTVRSVREGSEDGDIVLLD